jgi:hypothetical protein
MEFFNRITAAILAFFAMIISFFIGDSGNKNTFAKVIGNEDVKKVFADYAYPDYVVKDLGVDFNHKPDLKGLTKKTEKSDDITCTVYYDKDGKKVYSFSDDRSENTFDYFTKTKDGTAFTVTYYRDDNNKNIGYRAESATCYVSASKEDDGSIGYYVDQFDKEDKMIHVFCFNRGSKWYIENAGYFTDKAYVEYSAWDGLDGKREEFFEDRYLKKNSVKTTDVSSLYDEVPFVFCMGRHILSYTEKAGKREWYMTFGVIVQFETIEAAEVFAEKHGTDKPYYNDIDGETPEITIKNVTLKFSDKFKNFADFAKREVNDFYSLSINLDDKYEITGFNIGDIQFY